MPAERPRGSGHQIDEPCAAKRRHRIVSTARPLEDVAAWIELPVDVPGGTRHADFVLDLVVVALELIEAEGPVIDGRAARDAGHPVAPPGLADDLEIPGVEPPALRPVV